MTCRTLIPHALLRTTLLASAVTLPLWLAGCGQDSAEEAAEKAIEEAASEHGQPVKVDIDDGKTVIKTTDEQGQAVTYEATEDSATLTTEEGTTTVKSGKAATVPDNYPADGVQYGNLSLNLAMEQDEAFLLNGTTTDTADKVSAALAAEAADKGWTPEGSFQQGGMQMQNYTKGDRNLSVTINADNDQTQVNITISR